MNKYTDIARAQANYHQAARLFERLVDLSGERATRLVRKAQRRVWRRWDAYQKLRAHFV